MFHTNTWNYSTVCKQMSSSSFKMLPTVEKRKISYFGLARNLIRHLISPNQDDLSYSARTFISG